jgi:iron complex outermembrane recepter protein
MRKSYTALLLSASLAGLSAQAQAQALPADATDNASEDAAAEPTITVTGSRLIRNGDSSPSPVTVVQTSDLLTAQPGANLADALNVLPVFAGSRGAGSNPSTAGSASGGNGSANQLNLRNLGIQRTLVLVDGVRIPPTLFNGSVDVDLIPQMLVERVDVVTGGVSAVYGSDAVAGVVNYVLDKDFTGLKVEASGGVSEYGDASQLDAGVAFGTNLGSAGHFEASYQYHSGAGILRRSSRPWMKQVGVGGAGTVAAPYQLFENLRQANFPSGGMICGGTNATTCLTNGRYFVADGTIAPFVNGTATGTAGLQVGGAGGTWDSSLFQPLESHQAFARFDFDISDAVRFYAQVSATFKENQNFQEYPRLNFVQLRVDNPFLPAAVRSTLTGTTFRFSRTIEQGDRINQVANSEQWFANVGLSGDLGSDWKWGIDYVHGRSILDTQVRDNINSQRLSAALDVVLVGTTPTCYAATQAATATQYANCVPLNPFGPTATSAAALDYIMGTTNYNALTVMNDISGGISGSLFDLGAGPINVALSAEWRKVSFIADSDASSQDFNNCTNLRYNCTANQITWFVSLSDQPKVSQTVWEVASEVEVPVFKDWALGSLTLNGAARFTRYNTSGDYWTWKVGFDWRISDTLRFRGTRSRDIRAPTLYDLFAERFVVSVQGTDLLTGQSPTIPSINGGNPNLIAEIGNTLTGGVVWRPSGRLSIALDAYKIEVSDAILSANGGEQAFQQACYASGGTSPYCLLQERPGPFTDTSPSNQWTTVYNGLFNISSIKTYGIDLEVNYNTTLFERPFTFRLLGSYQPQLQFAQPNVATREQAGSAFGPVGFAATPKWRIVGFMRFKPTDNFTVDIMQRWRSGMKLSGEEGASQVWVNNRMDSFTTTSINLAYNIEDERWGDMQFYMNVANLFDAEPPIGAFYGNGTRAGLRDGYAVGDDPRGRYFTAGVKLKF